MILMHVAGLPEALTTCHLVSSNRMFDKIYEAFQSVHLRKISFFTLSVSAYLLAQSIKPVSEQSRRCLLCEFNIAGQGMHVDLQCCPKLSAHSPRVL